MSRYGRVGRFGTLHPRIRGALDPSHEQNHYSKVARLEDYKADEETYFVPSFSIRRHLHRSEEPLWDTERKLLQRRLGRPFSTVPATDISLKIIDQHRFIKNMREAGIQPEPEQIRDLAYSIRDGLTNLLSNARSPLEVRLGKLGRFGYKDNAVAYEIDGWRGDRAMYGENSTEGIRDNYDTLLNERWLAIGAIATEFEGTNLKIDGIVPNPHLTIARYKESIADYRMREIRGDLADIALSEVQLGDPVINMKLYREMPSIPIPVGQAWESLAPLPQSYDVAEPVAAHILETAYDSYDAFEEAALLA